MTQDQVLEPVQPTPGPGTTAPARPDLRLATGTRGVDLAAAERAAGELSFRLTTFPNNEGYDELMLARGIPFRRVPGPDRQAVTGYVTSPEATLQVQQPQKRGRE